jgi:hypothetical protein
MMAEIVYVLCAATSILCALLLLRGYLRTRTRLLMWSTWCFVGLAINNILLFLDLAIFPDTIDLRLIRAASALAGMLLLVVGLIWEAA